jgi:hypothetical protein
MKLKQLLMTAGIAAVMALSTSKLAAQDPPPGGKGGDRQGRGGRGGGGFDPAQMQERMMENIREQFAIKDDTEWKAVEPLVKKVTDARRENAFNGMRMMFRRPGGDNNGGGGGGRRGGGFGGEPSAEEDALQKAIDSKASKEELKTKMAALRKVKQTNEAKLKVAQDELKKVLTVQQEAAALQMGLVQ